MKKYDFIRFGGLVQWKNDITDTCRIMQVCCPPPNPITGNTEIKLIPTDDSANTEEESKSYSVSAKELSPQITPFNYGYWCALQTAIRAGADTNVSIEILRDTRLTFEECLFYMQYSNSYTDKLYSIIDLLFPEESKHYSHIQTITWNEREYPTKKLTIFKNTKEEQEVTVSVTKLGHLLIDNEAPISDEAEELDSCIFFYLLDQEINLPDEDIIEILESI